MKKKIEKEISELLNGQLKKDIGKELAELQDIRRQRAGIKGRITSFTNRCDKAELAARDLEARIREAIIKGDAPTKLIEEANGRVQEIKICREEIEAARDQDLQLQLQEKDIAGRVSEAAWLNLQLVQAAVEGKVRAHLDQALLYMATHEEQGLALFRDLRLDLRRDKEMSLGRFLGLQAAVDDFEAYCQPAGREQSYLDRKQIRRRLLNI